MMGRILGQDSPGKPGCGAPCGHEEPHGQPWAWAEGLEWCLCLPQMPFGGWQQARGILENRLC